MADSFAELHKIEPAPSGRARCNGCREAIAKGELRFGEAIPNNFGGGGDAAFRWFHLSCAAGKKPLELEAALGRFEGELPTRAALVEAIAETIRKNPKKARPAALPFAERAATGRSRCLACEVQIEKGELRIAIEREVGVGAMVMKSNGYLHPACALAHTGDQDLLERLRANSSTLGEEDIADLELALRGE